MPYKTLSSLLLDCHIHEITPVDLRTSAGELCFKEWGLEATLETKSLVNVAALSLSMPRLVVHRPSPEICEIVRNTDISSLPPVAPRLLCLPFVIEAAHPATERLVDDIVCIGGYWLDGVLYVIAMDSEAISVAHITPDWGGSVETAAHEGESFGDTRLLMLMSTAAMRFALTLAVLLDADNCPVVDDAEHLVQPAPPRRNLQERPRKGEVWTRRTLFLSPTYHPSAPHEATGEHREGLRAEVVNVRGFLRRQPYGPGGKDRKWMFIAPFESVRWVGDKGQIIDIK